MGKKKKCKGMERRKDFRISYLNVEKPRLKIEMHKFDILDISQRGLKFINDKEIILSEYISGKLIFLCGESVVIEGSLVWEQDDDFGLYLKNLIPSDIIQKETLFIQEQLLSK